MNFAPENFFTFLLGHCEPAKKFNSINAIVDRPQSAKALESRETYTAIRNPCSWVGSRNAKRRPNWTTTAYTYNTKITNQLMKIVNITWMGPLHIFVKF